MSDSTFITFGPSHAVAVLATAAAAAFMVKFNRSHAVAASRKHRLNSILAVVLLVSVAMDPVCTWIHKHADPEECATLLRENTLPFHLCDIVSIVLAIALLRRHQRCAELGYLWGLAGTLQGLITPTLEYDWDAPDYYAFFAQHGGVIVAALVLAFGAGLPPQRGALRRTMGWSWAYMAAVCILNALLHTNYGYFNAPPKVASLIDYLGPWPWYLVSLQGVAVLFFAILLLPFRKVWMARAAAEAGS